MTLAPPQLLTEDQFAEQFTPLVNVLNPDASYSFGDDGCLYETYGAELDHICGADPRHIWTLVEEDGRQFILSGWHFVNRLGYFLTARAWPDAADYLIPVDGVDDEA